MNELKYGNGMPVPFVKYVIELNGPDGYHLLQLSRSQMQRYGMAPREVLAELLGINSFDDYAAWVQWNGRAQCSGAVKSGRRCRCRVPKLRFHHPLELANFSGGLCGKHRKKAAAGK